MQFLKVEKDVCHLLQQPLPTLVLLRLLLSVASRDESSLGGCTIDGPPVTDHTDA